MIYIDTIFCTCGKIEDTYHYFFLVSSMLEPRMNFLTMCLIQCICNLNIVNNHVLFWGDTSISDKDNEHLFSLVHVYIKKSVRFNIQL